MGIKLLKGMGKAYQTYKRNKASKEIFKKIKAGKSSREERIKHGIRDKDIKSVPMSTTAKKGDVSKSVEKAKDHFYLKNIREVEKHKAAVREGEKAKKKLKHMTETKRAFRIGKTSIHPSNPSTGNK
jgi:hypothetical protein